MNKPVICLLLLSLMCPPLLADQLPPDFSARYSVKKYASEVAEMQLSLQRQENIIRYHSHTEARGLAALLTDQQIDETSRLDVSDASCPRLLSYQYRHRERASKNQQFTVSYPGEQQASVEGSYGKQAFQLDSGAPLWDRLSVQLALLTDAAAATPAAGQTYRYRIIDDGRQDEYVFEFTGEAMLTISGREVHTLIFKRHHGKRTTTLWLGRELHYLPVKIEQHKNGDLHLSMSLEQIKL
jgi:hypothetical protein